MEHQKSSAEGTDDLIGNKITDRIANFMKNFLK